MLFLFLIISQLMAMEVDVPIEGTTEISPRKTTHKRLHDNFTDLDCQYLLKSCEDYQADLKEKEKQPKYSNIFICEISKLIKKYPNFLEIIYGKNIPNNTDHSPLFSHSAKKRKLKENEFPTSVYKDALDDIKPLLATPTKIGTNTYHFPIEGILPEGTPRREESLIRLFTSLKMPVYVINGELCLYHMHHLCQLDQYEDILLLSKNVHQKDSGVIHTAGKTSEIDRVAFNAQKIKAAQLYFLRKIGQVVRTLLNSHAFPNANEAMDVDVAGAVGLASVAGVPLAGISSVVNKLNF